MEQTDSNKVKQVINELSLMRDNGKILEAIKLGQKTVSEGCLSAELFAIIAHCHLLNDKLDDAIHFISEGEKINSNCSLIGWNKARILLRQKKFEEATKVTEKFLENNPNDVEGLTILGGCLRLRGKLNLAEIYLSKSLSINPNYSEALLNKGLVFYINGDLALARLDIEKAHKARPHVRQIWPILAEIYQQVGEHKLAKKLYLQLTKNSSINHHSNSLAKCQISLGEHKNAIGTLRNALKIDPESIESRNLLGISLIEDRKIEQAIFELQEVLRRDKDNFHAHYYLGRAFGKVRRNGDQLHHLSIAHNIDPNNIEALHDLGVVYRKVDALSTSEECFNRILKKDPGNALVLQSLGVTLLVKGNLPEAIKSLEKAISLDPKSVEAHHNLGAIYQSKGDMNRAILCYKKAIELSPKFVAAHRHLSLLLKYNEEEVHLVEMLSLLSDVSFDDDDLCQLKFALAKAYDDCTNYDLAFKFYSEGNALRKALIGYDYQSDVIKYRKQIKLYSTFLNSTLKISEEKVDVIPIFIVGMPRSGTTLIEQIISSHNEVAAGGELTFISKYIEVILNEENVVNESNIRKFREKYLKSLVEIAPDKKYVTDKMPHNFLYMAAISAALPEAKIVHVKRSAAATCWSNFTHYFPNDGLDYSYDLKDIVKQYSMYLEIMDFWNQKYSGKIININYDKLVNTQAEETEKLISQLDLSWDASCLKPHKNKRQVKTASQQQVRKKVYTGSSQNWKKFEKHLNGVFDTLR